MAEDNKVDLVAQLPDEVLMEIFGHLPSLRDKLRLESVNTRFQRCLLGLLRTRPIPFEYSYSSWEERLNGYNLTKQFPEVLQSLGKKAKFNSVDIDFRFAVAWKELDSVLSALVSSDIDCLNKVTTFKVISDCVCRETIWRDLFAKCTKLSEVRLEIEAYGIGPFALNLGVVLKEKALTRLSANLFHYTQELMIQMFKSIKPNTLKKIDLLLTDIPALNMDVLVSELCGGGWSALEEIDIRSCLRYLPIDTLDTLFSSLTRLPKLRKCSFVLSGDQFVPALTSLAAGLKFLFANHAEITVDYEMYYYHNPTGCELVVLIRQVQSVHPDLEVVFGPTGRILTLTLGKVSFKQRLDTQPLPCDNAQCPECRIFYPTVIYRIVSEANRIMNGEQPKQVHLANARLDRCRVDCVADHLNQRWVGGTKALVAEMNEDHNLATITFKPQHRSPHCCQYQFKITVDCGHCLTNGCFACLYVG